MQDYELTAWLGDVEVTSEQREDLLAASEKVGARYPGEDDGQERLEAFNTAAQIILGDTTLEEQITGWRAARAVERAAMAALTGALLITDQPENQISTRYSLNRGTVRKALGK